LIQTESQPDALCWRVHLAARRPRQAAAAALMIGLAGAAAQLAWPGLWLGPAAALLLFLATSEFFLPIHYRITPTAVSLRNGLSLRHMPWSQVRRCAADAHGIALSPLARPSRLDAFRGLYLRLPEQPELAQQVLGEVARRSGDARG
jgi:hypothetical protein